LDTYPPITSTTTTGSTTVTPTGITTSLPTTVTSTDSSSNNVAIISGSVIGAIVFTIALIVILVLFIKRSKRNKFERHENNNNNRIIDHEVVDDNDSVPSIKHFLETLDQKYGSGLFTQYLNNFISESIDVSDISTLSNNEFESLGINKIGIRKKITREAEKYKI